MAWLEALIIRLICNESIISDANSGVTFSSLLYILLDIVKCEF